MVIVFFRVLSGPAYTNIFYRICADSGDPEEYQLRRSNGTRY
jgi:hypothetical protein